MAFTSIVNTDIGQLDSGRSKKYINQKKVAGRAVDRKFRSDSFSWLFIYWMFSLTQGLNSSVLVSIELATLLN